MIEFGLSWLREHKPKSHGLVLNHGDFRVGNFIIDNRGLVGVLDWEFAHLGDPVEDLAPGASVEVRDGPSAAWGRGGSRALPQTVQRDYRARGCPGRDLLLGGFGQVKWAIGSLNQARRHLSGQERSVELAVLGRLLRKEAETPGSLEKLKVRVLELNRELARHIHRGEVPEGTSEFLKQTAEDKLRVASPRFLEHYEA